MSVKIVNGNLLDATEDIICHQVNCQGVMGSGVAKAIREKWPRVYERYKRECDHYAINNSRAKLLGKVQYVCVNRSQDVANMFAQCDFGYGPRFTNYEAFYECLEDIKGFTSEEESIAFPYKIGSDRGGASWDVIYAMICDVLGDRDVTIYRLEETEKE